jgi:hypothetical protein
MNQIVVRLAVPVIIASILPASRVEAQGQNVITTRVTDASPVFFPCAAGIVEKQDRTRVQRNQTKAVVKAFGRKRSRKMEGRL